MEERPLHNDDIQSEGKSQNQDSNSFRSMFRGTSLMGGVQVFQILISLIRVKFVALFLGPDGMGISSLFNSSANTISQFSVLGMNLAVVKETAQSKDNPATLAVVVKVGLTAIRVAAIIGAFLCVILSPWLSQLSFGSDAYQWQYMLLGLCVYMMVDGGGRSAVLQGLHKMKIISQATLTGTLAGLVLGVPLYWIFGNLGIVPAMIVMSGTSAFVLYRALAKVLPANKVRFSWRSHKPLVKQLILLGVVLMSSSVISSFFGYLINIWISRMGSIDDVGLFNAANSITNQYSSLVFTAMSLDYFPRLAAVASDTRLVNTLVNRQSQIVAFIIAPAAIMVMIFAPLVIRLLLTTQFLSVAPLVRWMSIGIMLKAFSFPLGYIAFAKDNKKLFFWLEGVICNLLYLLLNVSLYYFFGLIGLGYSIVIENVIVITLYYVINRHVYGFIYDRAALVAMAVALTAGIVAFLPSVMMEPSVLSYSLMTAALFISLLFSFKRLKVLLKK